MTTITAPGADQLPWDEDHCAALGPHPHSYSRGCRVQPDAAAAWNKSATKRLSRLHQAAAQRVVRRFGTGALHLLVRVPELQGRGVLHYHLVLGFDGPHRVAASLYVQALHELAPRWEFGFVDRKLEASEGVQAALYLAKYLTKGGEAANGLRRLLLEGFAPPRAIYVATRLTMQTKCTMRTLRAKRWLHRLFGGRFTDREAWALAAVIRGFNATAISEPAPAAPIPI